jgi:hypothetical protein
LGYEPIAGTDSVGVNQSYSCEWVLGFVLRNRNLNMFNAGNLRSEVKNDPRGGFVLALVVLLLFGIGVAGAVGYQVVLNEAVLSVQTNETQAALSIARAGLRRYVSKQVGVHDASVTYSIDGGDAVVTARLVAEVNSHESLYLLSSEGVYTDPTFTGSAARRTVHQYARKREVALNHVAMLTQVTGDLHVEDDAHVDGQEEAGSSACAQASVDIAGVMMGSGSLSIGSGDWPLEGDPDSVSLSAAAALDSIGIDWALLSDTEFPVDFEDTWPSCALPADSFTVTRFNGNLTTPSSVCGQGVLIVTGNFTGGDGFQWNGILLAGYIDDPGSDDYRIDGLAVGGLDGNGVTSTIRDNTHFDYHRCYAFEAGKILSHFEAEPGTWWEEM